MTDSPPGGPGNGGTAPAPGGSRRRMIAGVVAIAAVTSLILGLRWRRGDAPKHDDHRDGLKATGDVYVAALTAPEGSTPCESSYNALLAMQAVIDEKHLPRRFEQTPDEGTFLSMCQSMPSDDQQCLVPKYRVSHRDTCEPIAERVRNTAAGRQMQQMLAPGDARDASPGGSTSP